MKLKSAYTAILFILWSLSFGQTGKLTGKILDKNRGETIPGVAVLIKGTTLGTSSDMNGNYSIGEIPVGTYSVEFRFIGYQTLTLNEVKIEAGKITSLNAALEQGSIEINMIEIAETAEKSSNTSLIIELKNAQTVKSGITAEDIKRSPDNNTAQAIRRISGVTIQDNRFAIIRGLSERYNYALIDNVPLPGTEADKKAFSFNLIPSNLIDNIYVNKTASADMPSEFAGGVINIATKDIPTNNFFEFSLGAGYNSITTFRPYKYHQGGSLDLIGFDDGTRAIPNDFPDSETVRASSRAEKGEFAKRFNDDWNVYQGSSNMPNISLKTSGGVLLFKEKLAITAGLSYNKSQRFFENQRKDFDIDKQLIDFQDESHRSEILGGAIVNMAYSINPNHKIIFKNLATVRALDETFLREGIRFDGEQLRRETAFFYENQVMMMNHLGGEHLLNDKGIKLDWNLSYAHINNDIPDFRRTLYSKAKIFVDAPYVLNLQASADPDLGGRFFSNMHEQNYHGNLSLKIPYSMFGTKQYLKVGTFNTYKERSFSARVLGYAINVFADYVFDSLLILPQNELLLSQNFNEDLYLDEITNNTDRYKANSTLWNHFIYSENVINEKMKLNFGARFEQFNQQLVTGDGSDTTLNTNKTFVNILPSANVIYKLYENGNIRASYSRTISRPEFRELASFSFYDFVTNFITQGSPNLQIIVIDNYDLRYEHFFTFGGLVAVSPFYKRFQNPIEQIIDPNQGSAFNNYSSFQNAESAFTYGVELEYRQSFAFLQNKYLNPLKASFNLALIESQVNLSTVSGVIVENRPLQGQSPFIINTGFYYDLDKMGLSVSAIYNRIGRRIWRVGAGAYPDIYEHPRDVIDLQIRKNLGKQFEASVNWSDILAQDLIMYQDMNDNKRLDEGDRRQMQFTFGSVISFSLTYKLSK